MMPPVDSGPHCERGNDDEIEITPEMIAAGADELMACALPEGGRPEWERAALAAFRAMMAAKVKCDRS